MQVHLSDKANAVVALMTELEAIEQEQLQLGKEQHSLWVKQMELANKANAIQSSLDKFIK